VVPLVYPSRPLQNGPFGVFEFPARTGAQGGNSCEFYKISVTLITPLLSLDFPPENWLPFPLVGLPDSLVFPRKGNPLPALLFPKVKSLLHPPKALVESLLIQRTLPNFLSQADPGPQVKSFDCFVLTVVRYHVIGPRLSALTFSPFPPFFPLYLMSVRID